jgi:hypothetical protein
MIYEGTQDSDSRMTEINRNCQRDPHGKKKERKKLRKSVGTQYDSVFAVHP